MQENNKNQSSDWQESSEVMESVGHRDVDRNKYISKWAEFIIALDT